MKCLIPHWKWETILLFLSVVINGLKCIEINIGQNTCTLEECIDPKIYNFLETLGCFFLGKISAGLESILAWNLKSSLLTKNFYQVRSSISFT